MGTEIMKKLLRLTALVLALLLLWGCTPQASEQTQPTQPAHTEPTQATEPTPTTPEPEPMPELPSMPDPVPELEAVTYLNCVELDVFPEMLSLGGGLVVASRNTYNPVQGLINETFVINVYTDEVVTKAVRAHSMELVNQRFSDGAILLGEPDSGKFYVYDRNLTVKRSFSVPNLDGYFSYDRSQYYFVQDEHLWCMDVASGDVRRLEQEQDLRFESLLGIHPEQERLVARIYLSEHGTDYGLAVIEPTTGNVLLLRSDLTHVWLTEDSFYGMEMNPTTLSYDVFFGGLSKGAIQRIPTNQLYAPSVSYGMVGGTHYLLRRLAPDEGERSTMLYDLANGAVVANLGDYGFADGLFSPLYLPQEQLILGYYSQKEEKTEENPYPKETFHFVLINLEKLTFGEGAAPEDAKWQERVDLTAIEDLLESDTLPESLSEVRTAADALEKKYGVEILIGKQTALTCAHSAYSVAVNEDPQQLAAALEQLEQALAKYPAGFFKQLRNGAGEGGVSFSLTGIIKGNLSPTGFAQLCRDRYELVLDVTSGDLEKTIHHELWHAIEMYLSADTFRTEAWDACNPAEFAYYGGYDTGYRQLTQWTFDGGSGAQSHFVDAYGRINGLEDRARIWERIMTGDAQQLLTASALKAKLQIMAKAIRGGFDDASWTNPFWEQYL